MHGHGHPELAKKLNDKISKTIDEMFESVREFIRGEAAAGSAEVARSSQWDKGNARTGWYGGQERIRGKSGLSEFRRNTGTYRRRCGIKEVGSFGKRYPPRQPKKQRSRTWERKSNQHEDLRGWGSLSEIMYDHCFKSFDVGTKSKLRKSNAPLVGFSVGSTIHSMIKFPTTNGVETMKTSREAPWDCRQIEEMQSSWKEVQWQRKGTWQVHVDYSSLNKVCVKDIYPFLKVEEKVGSLVENQYSQHEARTKRMHFRDGGKKVLGLHGNGRRNKSRSKEGKGHTSRGYPRRSRAAMKPMLAADKHKSIHIKAGRAHVPISVNVVTDGPMEGMLKGSRDFGRLALWAADLKTYHILYVQRWEAKEIEKRITCDYSSIVSQTSARFSIHASTGHDPIRSRAGMVLVDPEEKEYSHAICLNFHALEEDMDCEALLAGLIAFVERGIKDLHVFVDSRLLVHQVEGNRAPRTEGEKRYREEIMDAMAPFLKFRITHHPKALNPKTEA
nr:hypothetical protein [Tanacetum cinerariifolium]